MKILFTADWHIKLGQKNVPVDWAIKRYEEFFEKISELEDTHSVHIISGDIFDRVPTLRELAVFYDFISRCSIPTLITTGNHESETKKKSFLKHLEHSSRLVNDKVWVVTETTPLQDYLGEDVKGTIVPYEAIKSEELWAYVNKDEPVFTHVRGEIPPHVKPEIPLEWLEQFPVVFAGDLHSHKNTQRNIVYPGSPMTTSFHRSITTGANGYLSIDSDTWDWEWADFELPQLIRETVSSEDEMVPTERHHTIYELEGSMSDLAGTKDNELLDKKVVKRASDVSLILKDEMTEEEELKEYLTYVLEIKNIAEVLTAYHEYN